MKYPLIIVFSIIFSFVSAQNKLHFFIGPVFSKMSNKNISESKFILGYKVGFDYEIKFFSRLSGIIEFSGIKKGGKIKNAKYSLIGSESYTEIMNFYSLELPLKLKYKFNNFFVFSGFGIERCFDSSIKFYNNENKFISKIYGRDNFNSHFILGVGFLLPKYIDNINISYTRTNRTWLSLPYLFELKNYFISINICIQLIKSKTDENKD